MGQHMSKNLSNWLSENNHPPLKIYNRTKSKLPTSSSKLIHSKNLKDLINNCDVIITSLSSDEAAKEVFNELFIAAREKNENKKKEELTGTSTSSTKGGSLIFVETSTLYPTTSG